MSKTGTDPLYYIEVKEETVMNGVGIDVSKGKSMVSVLRPGGEIILAPFEVQHTRSSISSLVNKIQSLDGESRIVMEHTGRYYEGLARMLSDKGLFVCAVNPKLIKLFDNGSLRPVKSDKADSVKIAHYALDKWSQLKEYNGMDQLRQQLKTMNRQFHFYMKQKTAIKNNLIALLDQTYPGVNTYFSSPARKDGSQKWVDFASTYWHVDCVRKKSFPLFTTHYQKWCKRKKYLFSEEKAKEIYETAKELVPVLPKDELTKQMVKETLSQLDHISKTVETLRSLMNETAKKLPEYPVVLAMKGVGPSLGPQLIAEIGDVRRFTHRGAITAFAGVDPGVDSSGTMNRKSVPTSKKGSPLLRKTLFQIMDVLVKLSPKDDAVYSFIDKKRAEGKPYYVYMTAGANKFLRIYYGRVREYLKDLEKPE